MQRYFTFIVSMLVVRSACPGRRGRGETRPQANFPFGIRGQRHYSGNAPQKSADSCHGQQPCVCGGTPTRGAFSCRLTGSVQRRTATDAMNVLGDEHRRTVRCLLRVSFRGRFARLNQCKENLRVKGLVLLKVARPDKRRYDHVYMHKGTNRELNKGCRQKPLSATGMPSHISLQLAALKSPKRTAVHGGIHRESKTTALFYQLIAAV